MGEIGRLFNLKTGKELARLRGYKIYDIVCAEEGALTTKPRLAEEPASRCENGISRPSGEGADPSQQERNNQHEQGDTYR